MYQTGARSHTTSGTGSYHPSDTSSARDDSACVSAWATHPDANTRRTFVLGCTVCRTCRADTSAPFHTRQPNPATGRSLRRTDEQFAWQRLSNHKCRNSDSRGALCSSGRAILCRKRKQVSHSSSPAAQNLSRKKKYRNLIDKIHSQKMTITLLMLSLGCAKIGNFRLP
jgi:hypothetical protein